MEHKNAEPTLQVPHSVPVDGYAAADFLAGFVCSFALGLAPAFFVVFSLFRRELLLDLGGYGLGIHLVHCGVFTQHD